MFSYRINIYIKFNANKKQEKPELEGIFKDV